MVCTRRALLACVAFCALSAGSVAHAQFLDLDIRTARGPHAAGSPQTVQFKPAGPAPPQTLTLFAAEQSVGDPAHIVFGVPGAGASPAAFLAANPTIRLIDADVATTSQFKINLKTFADTKGFTSDNGPFDYEGSCFSVGVNTPGAMGVFPATTVHPCDSLDVSGAIDGVDFKVIAAENSPALRLVIPAIGYDFTSKVDTGILRFNRSDSIGQIIDDIEDAGKVSPLAAKLLGAPAGTTYTKGALPSDGDLIRGSITVAGVTKTFAANTLGQVIAYMLINRDAYIKDFGLAYSDECHRVAVGGPITGTCTAASGTLSLLGIQIDIDAPANATDMTFTVKQLDLAFTSKGVLSRERAIGDFGDYANDTVDMSKLTEAYARYLAQTSPNDPLIGNPFSAQGQLTRAGLDLDTPSQALNEGDSKSREGRARDTDPSGWMVGGRVGHLSAGQSDAEFVDANFERGFRIREGSRMRLKVSMPASYIDYGSTRGGSGGRTATLGLRAALETPLIEGRWVIEPSASAAAFYSSNVVSSGALYAFGVSSRYKLAPVGRGHIVIGNAVTYSSTLHIEAGDNFATPKIQNTALRNGVAYQVPYGRFLGRQGTVRASYTYTRLLGDDLFVDRYHEVSVSYGVAGREAAVKQVGETLRIGLSGAFGHDFTAGSLTAGYRF